MPHIDAVLLGTENETLATQIACVDTAQQFRIQLAKTVRAVEQSIDNASLQCTVFFFSGADALLNAREAIEAHALDLPFLTNFVVVSENKDSAYQAFELGALDFLPSPLSSSRLQACLGRVVNHVAMLLAQQQNDKIDALLRRKNGTSLSAFESSLEHSQCNSVNELRSTICVKSGSDWIRLNLNEILWFEAAGDYVCIYTKSGSHIVCKPLKQFESELCSDVFKRISRSVIVNLTNVKGFSHGDRGGLEAQIEGDYKVKVGRRYRHTIDMATL